VIGFFISLAREKSGYWALRALRGALHQHGQKNYAKCCVARLSSCCYVPLPDRSNSNNRTLYFITTCLVLLDINIMWRHYLYLKRPEHEAQY
jgi:hypothetical protein